MRKEELIKRLLQCLSKEDKDTTIDVIKKINSLTSCGINPDIYKSTNKILKFFEQYNSLPE